MTAVQKPGPSSSHAAGSQSPDGRLPLQLDGRYLNALGDEHRLVCVAISARSAEVRAKNLPSEGSRIVCYFDGLGRVVGDVARKLPNGFIVQFVQTTYKRDKLADQLTWLVNKERLGLSDERQHPRYNAGGPAQLRLERGGVLNCRVLDISLTGAGFEALSRAPSIGEIVSTGNLRGEVVRSQGRSFGIRFLRD